MFSRSGWFGGLVFKVKVILFGHVFKVKVNLRSCFKYIKFVWWSGLEVGTNSEEVMFSRSG